MFPTATVTGKGTNLHVTHGDDSGLIVRFYYNKVHEAHYIKINVPGDQRTEWDRPVKEEDKMRFASAWQAYVNQQNQFGTQVMLKDWGLLNDSQVAFYNARNVHTVEHLANMSDGMQSTCGMGTRELVKKAQAYLVEMASQRQLELANQELSKRDHRIALLEEKINKMMEAQPSAPVETPKETKTLHLPKKEAVP